MATNYFLNDNTYDDLRVSSCCNSADLLVGLPVRTLSSTPTAASMVQTTTVYRALLPHLRTIAIFKQVVKHLLGSI